MKGLASPTAYRISLITFRRQRTRVGFPLALSGPTVYSRAGEPTPSTLYAARGRLKPLGAVSPTGSTVAESSTAD
jgi:hypothetical protein